MGDCCVRQRRSKKRDRFCTTGCKNVGGEKRSDGQRAIVRVCRVGWVKKATVGDRVVETCEGDSELDREAF